MFPIFHWCFWDYHKLFIFKWNNACKSKLCCVHKVCTRGLCRFQSISSRLDAFSGKKYMHSGKYIQPDLKNLSVSLSIITFNSAFLSLFRQSLSQQHFVKNTTTIKSPTYINFLQTPTCLIFIIFF